MMPRVEGELVRAPGGWACTAVIAVLTTLPLLMAVPPAAAEITSGTGCVGDATIGGVRYTQDQPRSEPILIPSEDSPASDLVVPYNGSVTFENLSHSGSFAVMIGPFAVTVADWSGENPEDDRGTDPGATYDLADAYDMLPPLRGQFLVRGTHGASGGSCTGVYLVEFEGNALESPVTIVGIVGAGISAALVVVSGRRRGPRLGELGGTGAMQ